MAMRIYLINLAKELTHSEVNQLKYIWAEVVPFGISSEMKDTFELFQKLEQNHHLSPELLKTAFNAIGRQDLAEDVEEHEDVFPNVFKRANSVAFQGVTRAAGLYICSNGWDYIQGTPY